SSGMLQAESDRVFFRHELARMAVEGSIPPSVFRDLHRRALEGLATPTAGEADVESLAYHAEAAGEVEAVLRFAPAAARRAATVGAHRQAAAHYAEALRFGERLAPGERAALLEARALACYRTDQNPE